METGNVSPNMKDILSKDMIDFWKLDNEAYVYKPPDKDLAQTVRVFMESIKGEDTEQRSTLFSS